MKKAALIVALLLTMGASFAYIEEYTTSDTKTLQGTGYTAETMKIIDTARTLKQGVVKDYVPYYTTQFYSDKPPLKWYQMVKRYFDPLQDEGVFGIREITYTNGWFEMSPSYDSKITPNNKYLRLYDKDIKRLDKAGKIVPGSNGIEAEEEADKKDVIEDL